MPDLVDGNGTVQEVTQTYTLADGDAPTVMYRYVCTSMAWRDYLPWMTVIAFRLFTGTPVLYIDLVTANATLGFQPTISKRGNGKHHFSGYHWLHRNSTAGDSFASVPVLGNLYEADYLQRK